MPGHDGGASRDRHRAGGQTFAGRHFADAGDRVVITGRRDGPLTTAARETGARGVVCDDTDPVALAALPAELPAALDVLVNNAGGKTTSPRTGTTTTPRGRRRTWPGTPGPTAPTSTPPGASRAPGGMEVQIGSIAADQGAGSYGAAKAALASWNLDLAAEPSGPEAAGRSELRAASSTRSSARASGASRSNRGSTRTCGETVPSSGSGRTWVPQYQFPGCLRILPPAALRRRYT
ncbi:hypothetical protein [Streptomyces sp. NPDC005955]|uniref:hypothetical protein n=1 Tax=Streptomyces sp. NPDC005955 TaxID=3364738 RepID=UPI0036780D54